MAEIYKLPGSSYEELVKIIKAYSFGKSGVAISLDELVQATGMSKPVISRNNGFLVQIKLISEGNKKAPTELCKQMGKAYELNMSEQIQNCWNQIIDNDEFLSRMLSAIQIKGKMSKLEFVNHIVFSSTAGNSNSARAGAGAIIEIFKMLSLVEEKEGTLVIGTGKKQSVNESRNEIDNNTTPIKKQKDVDVTEEMKESVFSEKEYFIQSYTFENGKVAKIIIPENASKDDLLALRDMLDIILKRKFKLKNEDI